MFTLENTGFSPDQRSLVAFRLAQLLDVGVFKEFVQLPFSVRGITGGKQVIDDDEIGGCAIGLEIDGASGLDGACLELTLALEKPCLVYMADVLNVFLRHVRFAVAPRHGQSDGSG